MPNGYHVGADVRITATFKDSAGTATDPTAVYLRYKTPAGVTTTKQYSVDAAVVKSATGVYYMDIDASAAGRWHWGAYSTGTGKAAAETYFEVAESAFS